MWIALLGVFQELPLASTQPSCPPFQSSQRRLSLQSPVVIGYFPLQCYYREPKHVLHKYEHPSDQSRRGRTLSNLKSDTRNKLI